MIFKKSIGIELRGEDMLFSALQNSLSGGVFTHFKRIANYQALNKEELRGEVSQFFRSNRLSKEYIVLGIPREDVVLRYLDLPLDVADNLKQVVQYQVQSFEPTEEDKFYYDYVTLKSDAATKKLTILLVMVKRSLLNDRLQLLEELDLRPSTVIASSIGLANIFLQSQDDVNDKTFILADLGSSGIELLALRNGTFAYSRAANKEGDQSWKDLVLREVDEAASKMRLGPEGTLEKIVLSGEYSESALEEIKAAISDSELLKDSLSLTVPEENKAHLQEAASTVGLAFMGLSRRMPIKMNLLPSDLRIRHPRWAYVPAAIFAVLIIALLIAMAYRPVYQAKEFVSELDTLIKNNKSAVEQVKAVQTKTEDLAKKIQSFESVLSKRDMNLEILKELTVQLPNDTYLSSYDYRDENIKMNGLSPSASDLVQKLEKSTVLKDVAQVGPISKDPQTGKERFNFSAKLER